MEGTAKMHRRLYQRGDTIVEVLIAIAIMSLILTAAYVTANRNYLSMQDAQERGTALKLLERETEAMKAYNVLPGGHASLIGAAGNFCMVLTPTGVPAIATNNGRTDGTNKCLFAPDATQANSGQEPAYSITIGPPATPPSIGINGTLFMLQARWDSILGQTQQNKVQIEYGVY